MSHEETKPQAFFMNAESYDRSINWSARLGREIPVLTEVFGPPGGSGVLDAGCGTGHQACALANRGYRVVGADASEDMLKVARRTAKVAGATVEFVTSRYEAFPETVGDDFDGLYCLANALAASGSREAVVTAVDRFARCLRRGGRLFCQVLNFPLMRLEVPCVRGPRVAVVDGREYISVRQFRFVDEVVEVSNITLWNDGGWKQQAHGGTLYPVTLDELGGWCPSSGLRIDETWGSYARESFDPDRSTDLILVATRL